jgi:predicted RNase H-like HicB family nuclease
MAHTYTAVITPDEDGTYTAKIGSIPGLVVEGSNYSEALQNIEIALARAIDEYHSRGSIPPDDDRGRNVRLPFGARIERITVQDGRLRRLQEEYRDEADDWY